MKKKKIDDKNIFNMKMGKQGFTLIELLATILILSLVVSITMYIAINAINSAKQKTYEVTMNNIANNANNYLLENSGRLFFIPDATNNYEYQCITVGNLVELDYLDNEVVKSKVSDKDTVSLNDYVYIERDIKTKAITKSLYVGNNPSYSSYASRCGFATKIGGKIQFVSIPDANTWAKSKEVTITYMLRNLSNMSNLGNYKYEYNFNEEHKDGTFTTLTANQQLTVNSNGTIVAKIIGDDDIVGSYTVSKIDREGPVISLASDPSGNIAGSTTINLRVTDTKSGVNYRSFTNEDIEVTIGGNKITTYSLDRKDKNAAGTIVNYKLVINDTTHSGKVAIKVKENSVFDNVENGNIEIVLNPKIEWKILTSIPTNAYCVTGLTYNGANQTLVKAAGTGFKWKDGTSSKKDATSHTVTAVLLPGYMWSDKTTGEKTITCTMGKKSVSVAWGNVTTFTYSGSGQAPTASVTTGVSGDVMEVTRTTKTNAGTNYTSTASCKSVNGDASKCNNYTLTGTTKTFSINKRAITVKATNQSKAYNGSALSADATCEVTDGSLVNGHTLTCTNTGSQTNAGSSTKTLGTVVIKKSTTAVTDNYAITKKNGTLTVTKVDATCPTLTAYSGTYDGSSHTITVKNGSGGTIKYRTATSGTGSGWVTTKPTGTSAGTTTVYVEVEADSNHNTKDCGSKTIQISKKTVTVKAVNKSMNFGGSAPSYTYTVTGAIGSETAVSGTAKYTVKNSSGSTVTVNSSLAAGTYTITPSGLTAGSNYTITYSNGTLTVNKVKAVITCANKDYNGSAQTIASCSGGTVANASKTKAGEYDITCKGDTNHIDADGKKCKINKVDASCPTLTSYSGSYDGNSHTITVSGGSGGTIQYRTSSNDSWSNTNPSRTSVGETTVYVQVAGDDNHNTKGCGSKTITITDGFSANTGSGACGKTFSVCNGKSLTCRGSWNGWTNENCSTKDGRKNYHKCNLSCSYTCNGKVTQISGDYQPDGVTATSCCTYSNYSSCTGSDPNGTWSCSSNAYGCYVHSGSNPSSCKTGYSASGGSCNCNTGYTSCPRSPSHGYYLCTERGSNCYSVSGPYCYSGYHASGSSCVKNSSGGGGGGGCFLAGTKVTTPKGYVDINKLKIGDMVLSYNEETGENEFHEVAYVFEHKPGELNEELYTLTFDDKNTLQITSSHRLYIQNNDGYEWLATKYVKKGDYVRYADGTYHKITKIKHKKLTKAVYNISVDNTHTFYIDKEQILVHNVGIKVFQRRINENK